MRSVIILLQCSTALCEYLKVCHKYQLGVKRGGALFHMLICLEMVMAKIASLAPLISIGAILLNNLFTSPVLKICRTGQL